MKTFNNQKLLEITGGGRLKMLYNKISEILRKIRIKILMEYLFID